MTSNINAQWSHEDNTEEVVW